MKFRSKLIDKRQLNDDTLVLVFEKGYFSFKAGQYIILSFPNKKEAREYSLYNGENENTLEVLIKTLPEGSFSVRLGDMKVGDPIIIDGPNGFFVFKPEEIENKRHVFIASGTGISPFRSYIKTYPNIDYELLHGIRTTQDIYEANNYKESSLKLCVSREESDYFKGRVTDYLKAKGIDTNAIYHLCGNSEMINDVSDLLESNGIEPKNIRTEVFF